MTSPLAKISSRIVLAVSIALVLAAVVLFALILLQPGYANTLLGGPTETPEPTPTPSPLVASINGYTITEAYLAKATALNQVLSELTGEDLVSEGETLQSLIQQRLVLQFAPPQDQPSDAEVEDYVARMQEAWDVSEEELAAALEARDLERSFLEETIRRLLTVQAAVKALDEEGEDITLWLSHQKQASDIEIYRQLNRDLPTPSPESGDASALPPSEDEPIRPPTTTPAPRPEVPDVAADFTLRRARSGTFTLKEQLEEGPVVLVFFERCG